MEAATTAAAAGSGTNCKWLGAGKNGRTREVGDRTRMGRGACRGEHEELEGVPHGTELNWLSRIIIVIFPASCRRGGVGLLL